MKNTNTPVLSDAELRQSGESIAAHQTEDGLILWFPGGHMDPWNLVECAMALDIVGMHDEALRAYQWLMRNQRDDGAWHQYYVAGGIEDHKLDANTIAYPAAGIWHHWLTTGDDAFLAESWPTVERAVDWVLELQQPTGEVHWAREPDGTPFHYALLTGSSSIWHSLGCALAIAAELGKERADWQRCRALLGTALRDHSLEFFAPKERWAMDWYYPVLTGAAEPATAARHLMARWHQFVIEGWGVRCVNDHPWVTTGETAECAIALARAGERDRAIALLTWIQQLRADDGSYFTGLHVPDQVHFPADERTTYSGAAMVLAHDALFGDGPGSALFR